MSWPGPSGHMPPTPSVNPPPAIQVPPYTVVHYTTGVPYPKNGHYWFMGAQPSLYDGPAVNVFATMNQTLRDKLHNNTNTHLMVWRNLNDAANYFKKTTSYPANVLAVTTKAQFASIPGKTFVIVSIPETIPVADIDEIVVHERGHAFDYAFGQQIGQVSVSSAPTSNFKNKVAADWFAINGLSRAVVFPRGVPNKKINMPGGTWTNYPAPGPTVSNEQILKDLFPWLFSGTADANYELFAHLHVQFMAKFLNDCPYAAVPQSGGGTTDHLKWPEVFTHFNNTAATGSTSYFGIMWNNTAAFIP